MTQTKYIKIRIADVWNRNKRREEINKWMNERTNGKRNVEWREWIETTKHTETHTVAGI